MLCFYMMPHAADLRSVSFNDQKTRLYGGVLCCYVGRLSDVLHDLCLYVWQTSHFTKRGNQLTALSVVCDGVHCSADQQWNRQTRTYSFELRWHHNEASQIPRLTIVYSAIYSGADERKHQSSASLAFVRGIYGGLVNCPHKGLVTRKMFPFDYIIMVYSQLPPGNWPNFTWIRKTETKGTGKQKPGGGKPQRNNRAQRTEHYTTSTTDCKNKCQNKMKHQRIMPENWKTKLETQKANYRTTKNNWWTQRDNYKTQKDNYWNSENN